MILNSVNNSIIITYSDESNEVISKDVKLYLNTYYKNATKKNDEIVLDFLTHEETIVAAYLIAEFLEKYGDAITFENSYTDLLNARILEEEKIGINSKQSIDENNVNEYFSETLQVTLIDYQILSVKKLISNNGGFEFSVPGSGKTIIAYSFYGYLSKLHPEIKLLVVGPKNASYAWRDEFKVTFGYDSDFKSLSDLTVDYSKSYLTSSRVNQSNITFINFEKLNLITTEIKSFLKNNQCLLIIDEGHKVKNLSAKVTESMINISFSAMFKLIMTGTPMPNGYEDLYSLSKIYSPIIDLLPYSYRQLKKFSKDGITFNQQNKLIESIRPYYSRISKQYLYNNNLLIESKSKEIFVEMDNVQSGLYENLRDTYNKISENISDKDSEILNLLKRAVLIRKMQISSNPSLLLGSIKKLIMSESLSDDGLFNKENYNSDIEHVDESINKELRKSFFFDQLNNYRSNKISPKNAKAIDIAIEHIESNNKLIIWDIFVENMEHICKEINTRYPNSSAVINGNYVGIERDLILNDFKERELLILIASPATLAESISLHRVCQSALYLNRNFNCAQFIQSKDRIHRINMPDGKTAEYSFLMNNDSIDLLINERLELKEKRMFEILDSDRIEVGNHENYSSLDDDDLNLSTHR